MSPAELQQLRADAARYGFLKRILLRRAPQRSDSGAATYFLELEVPGPIEGPEFNRIVAACIVEDNGRQDRFDQGGEGAHRLSNRAPSPEPTRAPAPTSSEEEVATHGDGAREVSARAPERRRRQLTPRDQWKPRVYKPKTCSCGATFIPTGPRDGKCQGCRG